MRRKQREISPKETKKSADAEINFSNLNDTPPLLTERLHWQQGMARAMLHTRFLMKLTPCPSPSKPLKKSKKCASPGA